MILMKETNTSTSEIDDVEKLYYSAFPEDERCPFDEVKNLKLYNSKLLSFYDNEKFIGFTFASFYEDMIYIVYLAVSASERNKHYGSKILELLNKKFNDKTIILSVEKPVTEGDIASRRLNNFYKKNGFNVVGFEFDNSGVRFILLYKGKFNAEKFKKFLMLNFPNCINFTDTDIT